jgi:hypothetical protein
VYIARRNEWLPKPVISASYACKAAACPPGFGAQIRSDCLKGIIGRPVVGHCSLVVASNSIRLESVAATFKCCLSTCLLPQPGHRT